KDHAYYLEGVDLGMPSNDTSGIETLLRMSRAVNRLKSIEEFSQRHLKWQELYKDDFNQGNLFYNKT
ncbi:hypothetical protein QA596_12790, partial [Balneolales bacterium ANBcel1]|nr:hypothetical protein [Balneolales bacterium ANBcel1]